VQQKFNQNVNIMQYMIITNAQLLQNP